MADIRIKDLATTATTTASDDFMAVDGAINGTRKLSAAAPAFLTSVTTPTLTSPASTNLTLAGGTAGSDSVVVSNTLAASSAIIGAFKVGNGTAATNVAIGGGKVNIGDTTAGSSGAGALVVAGGISAGAASYFGGAVTSVGAITLDATQSLTRALIIGLLAQNGGNTPYVSIKPVATFTDFALAIESTNSTSGEGLGLRIVAGSTASDLPLFVRDRTNATTLFSVGGTGAATFGGAVTTSAPTGGAGAWELGIANTVTPTSPNRTITIEIGGTVYYLAAKTTND